MSDSEAIYRSRVAVDPAIALSLIRPEIRAHHYDSLSVIDDVYRRSDARDPLSRELYTDIKTYLCDDILVKVDRASMAVGLEVRVPILDHPFMEFMATIPPHAKLRRGVGKYLFKEAVRPTLGTEIVDRPKMGFSVPLGDWFRGPLRARTEAALFAPDAFVRSILDDAALRRIWRAHQAGQRHMETMIWAVFMLEEWGRTFMQGAVSAPTWVRRGATSSRSGSGSRTQ